MALAGAVVFAFAGACGSDDGGGESGKVCGLGDTRACLGPGQCAGAQACLSDGSGYGACECGSPDSGAGGGGAGGGGTGGDAGPDSASGGTSGGGTGGVAGGAAGSGGAGGVAGGDAGDGSVTYVDDPCPSQTLYADCSETCGGSHLNCNAAECGAGGSGHTTISHTVPSPIVIRTAQFPGTAAPCQCTDSTVYALAFLVAEQQDTHFRATVGPPFRVYEGLSPSGSCTYEIGKPGCATAFGIGAEFFITTDDPSAPMRNIVIEKSATPLTCP